jgi:hypothetical protein
LPEEANKKARTQSREAHKYNVARRFQEPRTGCQAKDNHQAALVHRQWGYSAAD